jgi:hypothetical protein
MKMDVEEAILSLATKEHLTKHDREIAAIRKLNPPALETSPACPDRVAPMGAQG